MGNSVSWIVTVVHHGRLLKCALKVSRDALSDDVVRYPLETENVAKIRELLPLHVQSAGPIVAVEEIFEVHVVEGE